MNTRGLLKVVVDPYRAYEYVKPRLKGLWYKLYFGIFKPGRVMIGRNFAVLGSIKIKGPGKVIIGNDVNCGMHVTPWTYDPDAVIRIGNNVFLNGTRFGCAKCIEIGDNCIIADCRIMDTDFHSTHPAHRHDPRFVRTSPIVIGRNVWVTANCFVLQGVRIGDNSVISVNSVVIRDVPADCISGGNPAQVIKRFDVSDSQVTSQKDQMGAALEQRSRGLEQHAI